MKAGVFKMAKKYGLIGAKLSYTYSPLIHKEFGDYQYDICETKADELAGLLASPEYDGFNVTIPYKKTVLKLCDIVSDEAMKIGAVNAVVRTEDGRLAGYNTDYLGFMGALNSRKIELAGKTAVLLGAGGAARAVIWGLLQAGTAEVVLAVRNPAKAQPLAEEFSRYGKITVCHWAEDLCTEQLKKCSLLVNTTPLGMTPKVEDCPPVDWSMVNPDAFVYDIIYTPAETRFLREAREHGHAVVNGEEMLAGQGAEALKLWTGIQPDLGCMQQALRQALA